MGVKIDEEWRVKKPRGGVNYATKKSPIHYKNNKTKSTRIIKNSNRVFVSVRGGCSNKMSLSRHIDYITDKDKSPLTSEGLILSDKSDIKDAKDRMFSDNSDLERGSVSKETYNMVFSLRDYDLNDLSKDEYRKLMREAVSETISKKYPDNFFIAALHADTDNPHVHLCLNKMDVQKQKKIDIRKYDLKELKHIFSEKLIEKGFKVVKEPEPYKKQIVDQFKTNDFEFVKAGEANYEFTPKSPISFYVQYRTNRDQEIVTLWGKGLKDAVIQSGVQEGDRVKIKREVQEPGKAAKWVINVLEKAKTPDKDKLKTLFSAEEKAAFNKDQGAPGVAGQGVDKQSKPLKTLFTEKEKTDINKKEKGGDEAEIE